MSFWADQFVEVCYWAHHFNQALKQSNNTTIPAMRHYHQTYLVYVRMNLECALATYQLCRKQKELK